MQQPDEEWRAIPGWPLYEVSDHGRIRNVKTGHLLSPRPNWLGYIVIGLRDQARQRSKEMRVHRAVALAFIPNPDNLKDVNHKDLDKANNHVSNLEWLSHRDNQKHASAAGLYCPYRNPKRRHKLTPDQVRAIRREFAEGGVTKAELGRRYGCCPSNINRIIIRKWWASVE